jgi:hypothetical protein
MSLKIFLPRHCALGLFLKSGTVSCMPAGTKVPAKVFPSARQNFYKSVWGRGSSVSAYALLSLTFGTGLNIFKNSYVVYNGSLILKSSVSKRTQEVFSCIFFVNAYGPRFALTSNVFQDRYFVFLRPGLEYLTCRLACLAEVFLLIYFTQMLRLYIKIWHDRVLPCPLQFIIHNYRIKFGATHCLL